MQALTSGPRQHLSPDDVADALSLRRGGTFRHGIDVVTRAGDDLGQTLRFQGAGSSISWHYRAPDRVVGQSDDVAAVRREATVVVPAGQPVDLLSRRLRIWTELLLRTGDWARFYLGVFDVTNPGALIDDGIRVSRTLRLADKSYLWANRPLTEPVYVPAGTLVVDWVKADLQARFGETDFAFTSSSFALAQGRTFEAGISWLEVYSQLLQAAAFDQLTADEVGRPASQPLAVLAGRTTEQTYGAGRGKVVTAGQVEPLLPTLPNVVRFSARQGPSLGNVEGNGLRTVRNQSTGPGSIDARGGLEVELRVDADVDTQTELDAVALADSQRYFAGGGLSWTGRVGLNPRHSDRDVIGLVLPRLDLASGAWAVTSWDYPLSDMNDEQGATMNITAERRVGAA